MTPGLPFIISKQSGQDPDKLLDTLNDALHGLSASQRRILNINRFTAVSNSDYDVTRKLEVDATRRNYPDLV